VGQLGELEKLASTVKVIPVHKERFLAKIVDVDRLAKAYSTCPTVEDGERLIRRCHDFSKGPASVARVFALGVRMPCMKRRVLLRFPIS